MLTEIEIRNATFAAERCKLMNQSFSPFQRQIIIEIEKLAHDFDIDVAIETVSNCRRLDINQLRLLWFRYEMVKKAIEDLRTQMCLAQCSS